MKFSKHIFICTNQRANGEKSCGEACGMALVGEFKKLLKEKNLHTTVRAQRAGCLDACDSGPILVVYPEGVYYGSVQVKDVKEIVEEHIIKGIPVQRLVLDFTPQKT